MQTDAYRLWFTRIVTFSLSALAAASAAYWGLGGWGPAGTAVAPTAAITATPNVSPQALARALGGGIAVQSVSAGGEKPAAASRYALLGVVAAHGRGAALISVDGQPAKPVRVGNSVDGGLLLQSVTARRAVLASSVSAPAEITLELPLPSN